MNSREKYEVPDWVVKDYNSRVSDKDKLPLKGGSRTKNTDTNKHSVNKADSDEYKKNKRNWYIFFAVLFFICVVIIHKHPAFMLAIVALIFLWDFLR